MKRQTVRESKLKAKNAKLAERLKLIQQLASDPATKKQYTPHTISLQKRN